MAEASLLKQLVLKAKRATEVSKTKSEQGAQLLPMDVLPQGIALEHLIADPQLATRSNLLFQFFDSDEFVQKGDIFVL